MATAATATGNQMADALYGAGVQAAQGLVNGLKTQDAAIKAQMLSIANSMKAALKKALGIKSPSRVMADLARQVPAGVAVGVQQGSGAAESAMVSLSGRMVRSFASPALTLGLERASVAVRGATNNTQTTSSVDNSRSQTNHITMQGSNPGDLANELEWAWRTKGF
jgi:hypothetical protein